MWGNARGQRAGLEKYFFPSRSAWYCSPVMDTTFHDNCSSAVNPLPFFNLIQPPVTLPLPSQGSALRAVMTSPGAVYLRLGKGGWMWTLSANPSFPEWAERTYQSWPRCIIYISKELQMRSMTAESFTFFTFTFFLYFFPVWTGANHITQGIFAATKKGINVDLTKRWTVTKCYKYSV